jgi:SET domain-containing protein 6
MPSADVLRRYGYVTPEYRRYDDVEIPRHDVMKALATATGLSNSDLTAMVSPPLKLDYDFSANKRAGC